MMPLDAWGGRRFLLCVGCSAITSMLLWFGKLSDGSYMTIILATVGTYVAGNTYQKSVEIKTTGMPAGTPVSAPVDPSEMPAVIDAKEGNK
ncbi:MAG: hypothetical protein JWQ89_2522 [Devosia sp.]|uniref:hypothetical protein n=1 Tax=Devosia sp. TaxID=1871048 RepID=UPI00261EBBC3|nr:hypothetical protein [Devosia sp.]MDB5540795.1 hypothetical protein [Devosia sp.]